MQLRVVVYDLETSVGLLPTPMELQAGPPLNDTSSLTLKYSIEAAGSDLVQQLLDNEYDLGLELNWGEGWQELPGCRFIVTEDANDPSDEVGTFTITAVGTDFDLNGVVNLNPATLNKDTGKRKFTNATPGTFLATMLQDGQSEGLATAIDWDFSTTHDSSGNAWAKAVTMEVGPETTARQLLQSLTDQGMCDWRMEGNVLRIFNADTTMKRIRDTGATQVALLLGRDCSDAPQTRSTRSRINKVLVVGDEGFTLERSQGTGGKRGGRAAVNSQGGVTQTGTATLLADAMLQEGALMRAQLTRTLSFDTAEFLPGRDYLPGDQILGPGRGGKPESLRIQQVTIQLQSDGTVTGSVVLNDRFLDAQVRMSRRMNGIVGGSTISGGTNSTPTPPVAGKRKPGTVTGVGGTAFAYIDQAGNAKGSLALTWNPMAVDTAGIALEIERYYVRAKLNTETDDHYVDWGGPEATALVRDGLDTNVSLTVQVLAQSSSNVKGAWSSPYTVAIPGDLTAPPVPSAPTLTTKAGTVTVTWDGKGEGNVTMPLDFARVDVLRSDLPARIGALTDSKALSFIIDTEVETHESYTYSLRAYDKAGNGSIEGDSATIEVASVLDDTDINDYIVDAVDDAVIANGVNHTYYSLNTPTINGSEVVNDTWRQRNSDGDIIAEWRWAGAWISQELSHQAISSIDAGKITVGQLEGGIIKAGTVTADKLVIGDSASLTPSLVSYANQWELVGPATIVVLAAAHDDIALRLPNGTALPQALGPMIETVPGDNWYVSMIVAVQSVMNTQLRLYWYDDTKVYISSTFVTSSADAGLVNGETGKVEGSAVAPPGACFARFGAYANNTSGTGQNLCYDFVGRRQVGRVLIEDGAITAEKITTGAVVADKINAGAVTAVKIAANAVTADKISATAIDGKTITGATVKGTLLFTGTRTAYNTGTGTYMDANGYINVRDPEGNQFFTINPDARYIQMGYGDNVARFDTDTGKLSISGSLSVKGAVLTGSRTSSSVGTGFFLTEGGYFNVQNSDGDRIMTVDPETGKVTFQNGALIVLDGSITGASIKTSSLTTKARTEIGTDGRFRVWGDNGSTAQLLYDLQPYTNSPGIIGFARYYIPVLAEQIVTRQIGNGSSEMTYGSSLALFGDSSSGGASMYIGADGDGGYIRSPEIYSRTYGGTTQVTITSAGTLGRITSASKYKLNITERDFGDAILDLQPKTWYDKGATEAWARELDKFAEGDPLVIDQVEPADIPPLIEIPGLIAEDVEAAGLTQFVQYGEDGETVEGLAYDRLWVPLIPIIRDLRNRVAQLEGQAA